VPCAVASVNLTRSEAGKSAGDLLLIADKADFLCERNRAAGSYPDLLGEEPLERALPRNAVQKLVDISDLNIAIRA
jgi:hypothetical protein